MSFWAVFFAWPTGGVWANILASFIWVVLAGVPAYIKVRAHHRRVEAHNKHMERRMASLHKKIDKML